MEGDHILAIYEDMSRITGRMVKAARDENWEQLVTLERECGARFQALLASEDGQPRNGEYQRRKSALIRRVLDDDAQIRDIVDPWLARIRTLLGNTHQQKRLSQVYRIDT